MTELIHDVKAKGMGVGIALKPGTPVEVCKIYYTLLIRCTLEIACLRSAYSCTEIRTMVSGRGMFSFITRVRIAYSCG